MLLPTVNNAGYYYTITTNATTGEPIVGAVICPVDTYSPGLKKQRACVPCPTGFSTKNQTGSRKPTDCGACGATDGLRLCEQCNSEQWLSEPVRT